MCDGCARDGVFDDTTCFHYCSPECQALVERLLQMLVELYPSMRTVTLDGLRELSTDPSFDGETAAQVFVQEHPEIMGFLGTLPLAQKIITHDGHQIPAVAFTLMTVMMMCHIASSQKG